MQTAVERDRFRDFVDLILGSLDDDADGSAIAQQAYLSRFHFDRIVAAALRESPGAFRRRLLLERAAWRLGRSSGTVTEVAMEAGYGSGEGFERAVNRAFAVVPSRFPPTGLGFRLPALNGLHFHPPGGLLMPAGEQHPRAGGRTSDPARMSTSSRRFLEPILRQSSGRADGHRPTW